LFDVFHREVGVTLVHRLEECNLRVTSEIDILGAIGDELHEATSHCESFCTISRENNFGRNRNQVRNFDHDLFSDECKMSSRPEDEESVEEIEEGEIVSVDEDGEEVQGEDLDFGDDEDLDFGDDDINVVSLMSSLLATPDGDTVCSALVNLCYQLETQNKILIKMLSKMQPSK